MQPNNKAVLRTQFAEAEVVSIRDGVVKALLPGDRDKNIYKDEYLAPVLPSGKPGGLIVTPMGTSLATPGKS